MSIVTLQNDLEEFRSYVMELIKSGKNVSLDQAWLQWIETREVIRATNSGIDDVVAGRTMSLTEFQQRFYEKFGVSRRVGSAYH